MGIFNSNFFFVFLHSKFPPKAALQFAICKSYKRNSCRHPDTWNAWHALLPLLPRPDGGGAGGTTSSGGVSAGAPLWGNRGSGNWCMMMMMMMVMMRNANLNEVSALQTWTLSRCTDVWGKRARTRYYERVGGCCCVYSSCVPDVGKVTLRELYPCTTSTLVVMGQ